jgi:hypothetical protein
MGDASLVLLHPTKISTVGGLGERARGSLPVESKSAGTAAPKMRVVDKEKASKTVIMAEIFGMVMVKTLGGRMSISWWSSRLLAFEIYESCAVMWFVAVKINQDYLGVVQDTHQLFPQERPMRWELLLLSFGTVANNLVGSQIIADATWP